MLGINRAAGAGREQHHRRIAQRAVGGLAEFFHDCLRRVRQRIERDILEYFRRDAGKHAAVLHHVGNARCVAEMMVLDGELAAFVARDAHPAQVEVRPLRAREGDRGVLVIAATEHGMDRDDAGAQDFLGPIDILEKKIERLHPLAHSALDSLPLVRLENLRKQVANPGPVILPQDEIERHAHLAQRGFHAFVEIAQVRRPLGVKKMEQLLVAGTGRIARAVDLVPARHAHSLPSY